jgi:hypothetical protein
MAQADSTARKLPDAIPLYRVAPHNIEAEQALIGAILVNNEAFYRVSDFLEPEHFFEPIHQKIYDAENLFAGRCRYRRHEREPISRAPCRRSDHRHQCRGLRPHCL